MALNPFKPITEEIAPGVWRHAGDIRHGMNVYFIVEDDGVTIFDGGTEDEATLTLTDLDRVFFLRNNYLPQKSFGHWHNGDIQLTSGSPHTVVWPTV